MTNGSSQLSRLAAPWALPALALWGWQVELLPWGILMGLALEARRLSSFRLDITQPDFNRFWNFNAILFVGVALYLFFARAGPSHVGAMFAGDSPAGRLEGVREISATALTLLRWLPFIFYPMVLAQGWSRSMTLPWSTFSLYQQSRAQRNPNAPVPEWASRQVQPAYPYIGLVLLASTASTTYPVVYLSLLMLVIAQLLWPTSNARFGVWTRLGILGALLAMVLVANQGLSRVRDVLQGLENRLLQGGGDQGFDQTKSYTAIGHVGRLQESGRIVLRIQTTNHEVPGLFLEASFNRFRGQAWNTSHREFIEIAGAVGQRRWRLVTNAPPAKRLVISRYTSNGMAPLALPLDTLAVGDVLTANIETNALGSARLKESLPLAIYSVEFGEGGGLESAPEAEDADLAGLPPSEAEAIRAVAKSLGLQPTLPRTEAIRIVEQYFSNGFEYSLWQEKPTQARTNSALADFLLRTRAGHCEDFATATVLLLRAAGISTRYAVGYSPRERFGEAWIARGRDAHAWCMAYVDGRWLEVDTTPGIWREREGHRRHYLTAIPDLLSQLRYRFTVWRQSSDQWRMLIIAGGLLGLGWLAWRQLRGSRWRQVIRTPSTRHRAISSPGLDSEFFAVARRLERQHGERPAHETLQGWLARVLPDTDPARPRIFQALRLHQQLRFDPAGLPPDQRRELARMAAELAD